MESMATWEDGPEYAPAVRPDAFSPAAAPPIEAVLPERELPEATRREALPVVRPDFSGPQAQQAPLAALVPSVEDPRDPAVPFAVVTSTLTSMDSAWGAAHGNLAHPSYPGVGPSSPGPGSVPTTAPPTAHYATTAAYPATDPSSAPMTPPSSMQWPAPNAPVPPLSGPASLPGGYPPPGTTEWFGPGPSTPQRQSAPAPPDARAVFDAATPGLCVVLLIGGFLPALAPVTLSVAFALSLRVRVAQQQVRAVFLTALGFLGLLSLASLVLGERLWFADWWDFVGRCACLLSWLVLTATLALVYRALRSRSSRPPSPPPSSGYPSSWS